MQLPQSTLLSTLLADTDAATRRIESLARPLSDAQLRWHAPEAWGVGEVLEHLCISDDSYLEIIRRLVAAPDAPRAGGEPRWRSTIGGGIMAWSLGSPRKLPAPKMFRPGPAPRPQVLDEFLRRKRELAALMRAAAPLDWRRIRTASPVTSLLRLNLGDAFRILVVHTTRHAGQIERIVAHPDFLRISAA